MTEASRTPGFGIRETITSSAQNGLWYLAELAPDAAAHTLCRAYRVNGDLDLDALRAAWWAVIGRHESLRTTIAGRAGRPVQRIAAEPTEEAWSFADLTGTPPVDPGRFGAELATAPVRLADGPLARLHVTRLGHGDHLVQLVLHRVICDDESMAIVVDELAAAYAAIADGSEPGAALPGQPPRYADYARRSLGPDSQGLLDWWRAALTPPPPALDLPVDRDRPPAPSSDVGVLRFDWGAELADPLSQLSTVEQAAPATVLLAAFQTLLHRYTGEDRIATGAPVAVRPPEFAGTVGAFHNLLVLCTDFAGRPGFGELLGRVAAVTQDARDHRELPFEHLVQAIPGERDPRRIPLCDAMFVVKDGPDPELRLTGASVRPQPVDAGSARADLTLTVDRIGPVVTGSLEYRASLFAPVSARLILEQLRTLLIAALAEPDLPVDELPLDGPELLRSALRDADRIAAGPPGPDPVNELVHRAGARTPEAAALSWNGAAVSYQDLRARAAGITAGLPGGVAGQPVMVRMSTGPDQVAAVLAVLDAGAHLVCLGSGDVGERGRAMLAELRPACLVVDGSAGEDSLAQWYADELGGRVLDVADLPAAGTAPEPPVRPGSADRVYVAYTSGSTGRPKGIPQSHGTFAQFVTWFGTEFGIGPGSRVAQWAAPGYDASLCETFAALVAGATVCPVPDRIRANPEKIVDWLAAERITLFQTVPSFAREILRVISSRGRTDQLDALDHLLLAGEPLPGDLANGLRATLPSVRLVNLYGPTELILATWHEITGAVHGTAPIGRSIPGRQVVVLDEQDRPCPAGVTGNLVIRSPHITPGYLGEASGEREQFRPLADAGGFGLGGACYRTGDLGRLRRDGALEFRGRKDFQVKFNGIRLELSDIEAALAAHDSVAECAMVAVTDTDRLVTRLVAYVVPRRTPDGKVTGAADKWRIALRRRFGKAMPPVLFKTLIGMPRNLGGKVDRKRLPDPGPIRPGTIRAPETPAELGIAAIWFELGAEPTTVDDAFFTAGGHSLLVPRLLHEIRERLGVEIPLWEYFANPTVAGLAALVESHTVFLAGQNY